MADPRPQERAIQTESKTNTGGDIDRVQMASRLPDGTPHQTPGFEFVGDAKSTEAATAEQLRQQAVSAADVRIRTQHATPEEDEGKLSADQQALTDAHEQAAKAGEARAVADTKAHTPK